MTTHELAQKLLAGPNLPVYVVNEDAVAPEKVKRLKTWTKNEWVHHHTGQPIDDADGKPLPEQYVVVI